MLEPGVRAHYFCPYLIQGDAGGGGVNGVAGGFGGIGRDVRNPQSMQSCPKVQAENVELTPPSSHSPSDP